MESKKLTNMLSIIADNLSQKQIPFCLIGAMALGIYGLPRYTSDIDLFTEVSDWTQKRGHIPLKDAATTLSASCLLGDVSSLLRTISIPFPLSITK